MANKKTKKRRKNPIVPPKVAANSYLLELLARPRRKPTLVRAPCSCGGENGNCFKCFGTGFYDKELTEDAAKRLHASTAKKKPKNRKAANLATFASDSRGSGYSIREAGRFSSAPLHDDHGEESSS